MTTLIDLASSPLTPDAIERLRRKVADIGTQDGFVGVFCKETLVCITGLVFDGELRTWTMFPARDQDAALSAATELHSAAAEQVAALRASLGQAADATIATARRH